MDFKNWVKSIQTAGCNGARTVIVLKLDHTYLNIFFRFYRMPDRIIEVGNAGAGIPGCLGVLEEPFEKEDMSEMFRRAFLEKMNVDEPDLPNYHCTCS